MSQYNLSQLVDRIQYGSGGSGGDVSRYQFQVIRYEYYYKHNILINYQKQEYMKTTPSLANNPPKQTNNTPTQFHNQNMYNLSYKSAIALTRIKNMYQQKMGRCLSKGDIGNCQEQKDEQGWIQYEVVRMWKEEIVGRDIIVGQIWGNINANTKEVQMAILDDLEYRGHVLRNGFILHVCIQKPTLVTISPQSQPPLTYKISTPKIHAVLIQQKLNLPKCFTALPSSFAGFYVRNLSIANHNGTVTWNCPVDITGIDFSQDGIISIERDFVQLSTKDIYASLRTDVFVEFYHLPPGVGQLGGACNQEEVEDRLRKRVEKGNEGCRLVGYDKSSGHWFVHIILSKCKTPINPNDPKILLIPKP